MSGCPISPLHVPCSYSFKIQIMWVPHSEQLAHGCIIRVDLENRPVTFVDVLQRWQDDPLFRAFLTALLADAPYSAFRWETPPIAAASASGPFEFVLIDSPELETEPDPEAFAEHFAAAASDDVVSFSNLNHDAILVVPRPIGHPSNYVHIGAFELSLRRGGCCGVDRRSP